MNAPLDEHRLRRNHRTEYRYSNRHTFRGGLAYASTHGVGGAGGFGLSASTGGTRGDDLHGENEDAKG